MNKKSYQTKILNNHYAPGIATYGMPGKDGSRGETGTSLYFTTYNLEYDNDNEINDVLVKINQNKILSEYVDKDFERDYNVGDLIMDNRGFLYRLYEDNNTFKLQFINQLSIEDSSSLFQRQGGRVFITKDSNYNFTGLDLTESPSKLSEITQSSNYPLRIYSFEQNSETLRNNFITLRSRNFDSNEKYLNIFFDENTNSFHFETESAIVFDTSSLFLNENTSEQQNFSNYFKIEPYNNPLGLLHKRYSQATYNISSDNHLIIEDLNVENYDNMDLMPDYVKIKIINSKNNLQEFFFPVNTENAEIDIEIEDDIIDAIENSFDLMVSLIKGVEIFIKKS